MTFHFEVPGIAFFDRSGIRLLQPVPEEPEFDHPSSIFYFLEEDIHESTSTLRAWSVENTRVPALIAGVPGHDLWMSFFRDLNGNALAALSEVPRGIVDS